jgi:hypothetical protein
MPTVSDKFSKMDKRQDVPISKLEEIIDMWRALSPEERLRRQWAGIPKSVAMSMEFAGEPVDISMLEAEHAKHPVPYWSLKRDEKL